MKKQTKNSMLYVPGKNPVEITPRSSQFTVEELYYYLGDAPDIIDENDDEEDIVMIVGAHDIKIENRIGDFLIDKANPEVKTKLIICRYDLVAEIFE